MALFGLAYTLLTGWLERLDRETIESELEISAARFESGGLEGVKEEVNERHKESLFVRVAGPGNETLLQHIPAEWNEFDLKQLEGMSGRGEGQWIRLVSREDTDWLEEPDRLEILTRELRDGTLVQVGKSTEGRKDIVGYFQGIFGMVMIAVLGLGLAGGVLLADRSLRPVRELGGALRSIRGTGKLAARVPTRGTGDELDELAKLLNALLETIESLVTRMRGALDSIAHELRTPMTRLRGTAEVALRTQGDAEAYRQALADCLEEAEQTLTMLNTLMDLAEAETGAMRLEWEEANLSAVLEGVVGLYEHVAEEKGVSLEASIPEGLRLRADPRRIRQAVANVVDNAIKYTPAGGRVEIAARQEKREAVIRVKDTGMGIKSEELPRIWDRLYRGESSQTERGLGLGLSVVRAVVAAHKGTVEARSEPGQGTEFEIRLPVGTSH